VLQVVLHEVCAGVSAGKAEACAQAAPLLDAPDEEEGRPGMGPVPAGRTVRRLCQEEDHEVRNIMASVRGVEAHRKACLFGAMGGTPDDKRAAICEVTATMLDRPKEAAAKGLEILGVDDPAYRKHVEHDLLVMSGAIEPKDCAYPDPFKPYFCAASYVFHRVEKGLAKPADCGENALCRAMTGSAPAACEPYAREAKKAYCSCRRGKRSRAAPST
jgi:hypothetical protein